MITLYRTKNERVYEKLILLLPAGSQIKRDKNGKPYTDGVHFSVTHTGDIALIAVSDSPVGIDAEIIREQKHKSVLGRFTPREQSEISSTSEFLRHWVVKEAYIKFIGGTLAHDLKMLEYYGGQLFYNGLKVDCNIICTSSADFVYAICTHDDIQKSLKMEII